MSPTAPDLPPELAWFRAFSPDTPDDQRREAFTSLVARYSCELRSYLARRFTHLDEIEDTVSDVWLYLWQKALGRDNPPFLRPLVPVNFLFTLARHIHSRGWRSRQFERLLRRRLSRDPVDLDTLPSSVGDPAEEAETGELPVDFRAALNELPDAERLVITMRHFADCTLSEIAGLLHSSLDHASRLLARARVRLANRLSGYADLPSAPPVDFVPDTRAQGQPYRHWGLAPTRTPVPTQKAPPARPATAPLDLQLVGEFTPEQVRQVLDAVATAVRAAGGHGVQVVGPATHTAVPACVVASGGPPA